MAKIDEYFFKTAHAYVNNKRSENNDICELSNRQSTPKQILVCENTSDFYQGKHFTVFKNIHVQWFDRCVKK